MRLFSIMEDRLKLKEAIQIFMKHNDVSERKIKQEINKRIFPGKSTTQYGRINTLIEGENPPIRPSYIIGICDILGCSPEFLLGISEKFNNEEKNSKTKSR